MLARDNDRRDALRLILSSLKSAEKDLQRPLSDEEELQVLQRERKKRHAAADAFRGAGREPPAEKEGGALPSLQEFMREPLPADALVERGEGGHQIGSHTVDAVPGPLEAGQDGRDVLDAVVWRHRGKKIAPKTVTKKEYADLIRRSTVTFGIGPAGTGKTYLAMAMAVAALHEREVSRIILTRPAVEAGERLGFLPGDLMAKVDPYLRPLFDALYDMLDPDKANNLIERGTIEVAPLAFMRGRAQPLSTPVLTMNGFEPIGSLRIGDFVIGSNGLPTPVIGVYPQGRKEVFRFRTQDGASTLCGAEHLWHVHTPEGRRRGH